MSVSAQFCRLASCPPTFSSSTVRGGRADLPHQPKEVIQIEGLHHDVIYAGSEVGAQAIRKPVGRHEEDGARDATAPSFPHQQQTVAVRQLRVDHHHVNWVFLVSHRDTRLAPVLRFDHLVAGGGEDLGQGPPHEAFVSNHEDAWAGFCRLVGNYCSGVTWMTRRRRVTCRVERANME
jgi:hypothetical protein